MKELLLSFSLFFWPQCRASRRRYARDLFILSLIALAGWQILMMVADSPYVSDESVVWLGTYLLPVTGNLLMMSLIASTIRRFHDIGLSGEWAFLALVPGLNVLAICYALVIPGSTEPTGWTDVDEFILWRN